MPNKSLFYNKYTIITFIIITLLGLSVYHSFIADPLDLDLWGKKGGFPLISWKWAYPNIPGGIPHITFNLISLVFDLIIYYVIAVLISFLVQKIKK